MKLLKKFIVVSFLILNPVFNQFSYSSNYFDEGLKNLSIEIQSQANLGYDFTHLKNYFVKLRAIGDSTSPHYVSQFNNLIMTFDNTDYFAYKLNQLILIENELFINKNFNLFMNLHYSLDGQVDNYDMINQSFSNDYLKKHIDTLINRTQKMELSLSLDLNLLPHDRNAEENEFFLARIMSFINSKSALMTEVDPINFNSPTLIESHDLNNKNDKPVEKLLDNNEIQFLGHPPKTKNNLRSRTRKTSFPCLAKNCNETFGNLNELKKHKLTHIVLKPYPCTFKYCKKSFDSEKCRKRHFDSHSKLKSFKCDYKNCTKAFARKYDLKTHTRIHTKEKPYKCDYCNKNFSRSSGKHEHQRNTH